jgi:hypothetical protein
MNGHEPEKELLELLQSLRRATAGERPSAGVEHRLVAEFQRLHGAARPDTGHARTRGVAAVRRGRRAWLAAAASIAMFAGATAGWQLWSARARTATPGVARPALEAARVPPPTLALPAAAPPLAVPAGSGERPGTRAARNWGATRLAAEPPRLEFVAWPGAEALPSLESGQLVRTELPTSVVPLLGLGREVPRRRATVVADVIVGQDGQPRAVRLVSDER